MVIVAFLRWAQIALLEGSSFWGAFAQEGEAKSGVVLLLGEVNDLCCIP
jgi:hypothetical protein